MNFGTDLQVKRELLNKEAGDKEKAGQPAQRRTFIVCNIRASRGHQAALLYPLYVCHSILFYQGS